MNFRKYVALLNETARMAYANQLSTPFIVSSEFFESSH